MLKALSYITLFASLMISGFAQAGQRIDTAIGQWLSGTDHDSLPALATPASEGNRDAQLLLGRIETSDLGPSPFRLSHTGEETRALFRDNSGFSYFGQTWISVAADNADPLARALQKSVQPDPDPTLVVTLNDLGEHQATDYPTRIIALYGTQKQKQELAQSDGLQTDLKPYVQYLTGTAEPRGDGIAALRHIAGDAALGVDVTDPETLGMAGVLALGYGYGDLSEANPWRPIVENWLLSAPSTRPIADLCRAECTTEVGQCAFALLTLSGGYFETIRTDSPLESVIPQDQFLASPRARLMVLRRVALARAETNLSWLASHEEISEMSQCAADLVTRQRAAYP
ncbi:MAG: hypothetical protein ACU0BB_17215 [Paracoccaceae bacterium]